MGSDDLFKKAKSAKEKRKTAEKGKVKDSILIICEGKKTEPNYFESFRLTNVKIDGCGHNTDSLVERALKNKSNYGQIWCVFDRDSFPSHNFNRAFQLAEKHKNIHIAYSNEAFELWYYLHFHPLKTGFHRNQYQGKLTKLLKCKYQKNSKDMYDKLLDKQQIAIKNATKLLDSYPVKNPEQDNPSTTVHLLVEELNKYIK